MSINKITPPTGGAPINTDAYSAQNNLIQALLYTITQEPLLLTEWGTLVEPEIKQGVYIQHGGALFLVEDNNEAIAGAPADDRVYIKITEAADVITAEFVNSAAGYSWNQIYNGFYHADGTQLLPYIIWLDTGDWYKFDLNHSVDKYNITALLHIPFELEIGNWNMKTTATLSLLHNMGKLWKKIRNLSLIIRKDSDDLYSINNRFFDNNDPLLIAIGMRTINVLYIIVYRRTGGFLDSVDYEDDPFNRGWIDGNIII